MTAIGSLTNEELIELQKAIMNIQFYTNEINHRILNALSGKRVGSTLETYMEQLNSWIKVINHINTKAKSRKGKK